MSPTVTNLKVLGLAGSPNCVGPMLLAAESKQGEAVAAYPHADAIKWVNPWGQMPALSFETAGDEGKLSKDVGGGIAETSAMLRFLALSGWESAYPSTAGVEGKVQCALIDYAVDKFATGKMYKGFVQTVYPLFGYAKYTDTPNADKEAMEKELAAYFARFYPEDGKFVGGASKPTIADYRFVPFLFSMAQPNSPHFKCETMQKEGAALLKAFEESVSAETFAILDTIKDMLAKSTNLMPESDKVVEDSVVAGA